MKLKLTHWFAVSSIMAMTLVPAVYSETSGDVRIVSSSPAIRDHGDATATGSLASMINQAGKNYATIELPGNATYTIAKDLVIPDTITLKFRKGAVLSVAAKKTLTINGDIEAGFQQILSGDGEIAGTVQVGSVLPQWFGAKGDGIADDTLAVQKALDFACKTGVQSVDLNRGRYRITKTLNCTSTREPGTISRDGLRVFGSSFSRTALVGETGDKSAVIETSGCQWLHLENFTICSGTKNPSSVAIFTGVPAVLPQSQNHVYHVCIFLYDDMKANDGLGTIGIWNFGSEEHTYNSLYIHANRPIVLTAYNGSNGFTYTKSYIPKLVTVHSLGVTTMTGECFLLCMGKSAPAVTTVDINSLHMQNTYIAGAGTGKCTYAFEINGSLTGLTYSGTIEGYAGFARVNGQLYSANVNAVYGLVADTSEAVFILGSGGQIRNSDVKIHLCENQARDLFRVIAGPGDAKPTCAISNTVFKTNQSKERIVLPAAIRNSSDNVIISNHDTKFGINRPFSGGGR